MKRAAIGNWIRRAAWRSVWGVAALAWLACLPALAQSNPAGPQTQRKETASATLLPATSTAQDLEKEWRAKRRLRKAAGAAVLVLIALWGVIRLRRHPAPLRALWRVSSTAAGAIRRFASQIAVTAGTWKRGLPSMPRAALPGALASLGAAASLAYWAWIEAWRLGPLHLEVPWRYAMVSIGLSVLAVLLVLCAICMSRARAAGGQIPAADAASTSGTLAPALWTLGCVTMLFAFRALDVWNSAFDELTWRYAVYGGSRIAFMIYLAAALVGSGRFVLSSIERKWGTLGLAPVEHALAAFFAGAAAWYVVLFAAGLAGALRYFVVAPVFVLSVWLSWPPMRDAYRQARDWALRGFRQSTLVRLALIALPLGVLLIAWLHVLVNRGLAVTGFEYDSYGHYVPYYQAVVAQGGTGVNELWYHFWISKGAGLHFVATMLSDIQGPQLVSFTFLTAAVMAVGLLLRDISGSAALGISGCAIFLAPFMHRFPYYQKHHMVTAAMVFGLLWTVTRDWTRGTLSTASSIAVVSLLSLAVVLHAPPFAAVACAFLAIMAVALWVAPKVPASAPSWTAALPASTALAAVFAVFAANYAMTGLMEVTPFRLFWNLADQTAFSKVASPYLMLFLDEGTAPSTGKTGLIEALNPELLRNLLHVQFLPDNLALAAAALLVCVLIAFPFDGNIRRLIFGALIPAAALIASAAALGIIIRQPGSIDRFYIFALAPVTYLALSVPAVIVRRLGDISPANRWRRRISICVRFLLLALTAGFSIMAGATWLNGNINEETRAPLFEKLKFALGQSTFRETLLKSHQTRNPAIWPRREVSEACLGIRAALQAEKGAHEPVEDGPRVWTMTFLQEAGCHVLPGVRIMMEISNRFGEQWHRIVFGNADAAERELSRIGIDHVFVNLGELDVPRKTGFSTSIFGCLAYSPLLDPASLASRFRVAWNEGDAYLLVLSSKGTGRPLPSGVAERFAAKRAALQPGLGDMRGMCTRLAGYYYKYGEHWPVSTDRTLPALKGWQ